MYIGLVTFFTRMINEVKNRTGKNTRLTHIHTHTIKKDIICEKQTTKHFNDVGIHMYIDNIYRSEREKENK